MALSPQKFREIVLQLLYSLEMAKPDEALMTTLMMSELEVSKKNIKLAQERVNNICEQLPEIDRMIKSVSASYEFDRIQIVSKNILRLGVYELFFDDAIPSKVAIAEAIRLSRKFSSPESSSFVNALLDHLYQLSLGASPDPSILSGQINALKENEEISSTLLKEQIEQKESSGIEEYEELSSDP